MGGARITYGGVEKTEL